LKEDQLAVGELEPSNRALGANMVMTTTRMEDHSKFAREYG